MSRETCCEIFAHGMRSCDVGIVEAGDAQGARVGENAGGRWDDLCDWLSLPRIVVLDASQLKPCVSPPRPERADAILLDCVSDSDYVRVQTSLEARWGIPVLGGLGTLTGLRSVIDHLPEGSRPSRQICRRLGDELARRLQGNRLWEMAARPGFPDFSPHLFSTPESPRSLNVAVAYDEAFNCYFPDALDLLEFHGARLRDFSPLRDERLPPDTDLVYMGCGHPEYFAQELAGNHCMMMALRRHFYHGRRIYAEGGGAAYLCGQMALRDGRRLPMVGLLPAIARQQPHADPVRAVDLSLVNNNWLANGVSHVRGYLNSRWDLQRTGDMNSGALQAKHRDDLVVRHGTVGSRLHLSLAAQPQLLRSFLRPCSHELVAV